MKSVTVKFDSSSESPKAEEVVGTSSPKCKTRSSSRKEFASGERAKTLKESKNVKGGGAVKESIE